jgi:hypothetical protein
MFPECSGNRNADFFGKSHWHRIPDLPHALSPRTRENVPIWESLQTSAFSHSEVPNRTIHKGEHVFTARNPMVASL